MQLQQSSQISTHIHVLGGAFAWLYFIDAPRPVLLDTGMTGMAATLIESLKFLLNGRSLWAAAHTHSHFDHIGCTAQLQRQWPGLLPLGHPRVGQVLERPGALATIAMLNDSMAAGMGSDDRFAAPLRWRGIEDGASFDLGAGITLTAHYTPGHTRDTVTWFVQPDGLVVMGEACGVPSGRLDQIQVEFLTDPDEYIAGIEIIRGLDPVLLGLPHVLYIEDQDTARRYLLDSIAQTHGYVARLNRYFDEAGGDRDAVFERVFGEDFTSGLVSQPEPAFRLNLQAQVATIGAKRG